MKSVVFSTIESLIEYQRSHVSADTFSSTSCPEFIYCAGRKRCYLRYDSPNKTSTSQSCVQRHTLADCGSVDWISKWSEKNSMKKEGWIWSRSSRLNTFQHWRRIPFKLRILFMTWDLKTFFGSSISTLSLSSFLILSYLTSKLSQN